MELIFVMFDVFGKAYSKAFNLRKRDITIWSGNCEKKHVELASFPTDYDHMWCFVFPYRSCTDVLEMEVVATEDIQDVRNQVWYSVWFLLF